MHDLTALNVSEEKKIPIFYPLNDSLEEEMRRLLGWYSFEPSTATPSNVANVMEEFKQNGKDYEYCPDVGDNQKSLITPRRKKNKKPLPVECVFCKNNGEMEIFYKSHVLRDTTGRVTCPVLRAYTCKICGVNGDDAHTKNYCPKRPTNNNQMSPANAFKMLRNSTGKRRK
ncbi:protein nanos [Ceratina calcarata]|uniref:Protein nanos n=1 Tax=Ceratina calcarata TaxID=156304 RepID=A0AAJ7J6L4_9HYME|nr:protein nanos [Ceratina calcarata]